MSKPMKNAWWQDHMLTPLDKIEVSATEAGGNQSPESWDLVQIRRFADQLLECCGDDEMRALVQANPDVAMEFHTTMYQTCSNIPSKVDDPKCEKDVVAGKPFAALATYGIELLDEMIVRRTTEQGRRK